MYGRYGNDSLNRFLFGTILVIFVADLIIAVAVPEGIAKTVINICLSVLSLLIIVVFIGRTYSRKIQKRRKENQAFLNVRGAIIRYFSNNTSHSTKSNNVDTDGFIFRDCTKCHATLRLPRKEGRNSVKCPKCSHSFFVTAKAFDKNSVKKK